MRVGRTKLSYIDDRHFWDDVSFVCLFAALLIYRPSREKGTGVSGWRNLTKDPMAEYGETQRGADRAAEGSGT